MQDDIPSAIITIGTIVVVFAIVVYISSAVVDMGEPSKDVQTAVELEGTNWVTIDDTVAEDEHVYDSGGYALNLTGANDSYFESTDPIELTTSDNWTTSAWGLQDETHAENQTLLSVKGEILISYDGSSNNWSVWFYDSSTRDSYRFSVNATEQPTDLTNVVLKRTNNTLTLYEDATALYTKDISGDNVAESPDDENWNGRVEEVRVWQRALTSSEITDHTTDPIDPIPTNATARVMFDEPYRDNQLLFYNSGEIETFNATYSDGLPGTELTQAGLLGGDYEWRKNGPQIKPTEGGELEYAPVAYVGYGSKSLFGGYVSAVNSTVKLAMAMLIIIPLGIAVAYLYTVQGRR